MTLISNAVRSIQVGIDDYDDHTRVLSAVRDVHAGILLLFKEKLRRLSPAGSNEVLLRQRIIPRRDAENGVVFVGTGKKTVDIQEIKERFSALDIKADWSSFDRLTAVRNNVEHYYSTDPSHVLQEAMASAFSVANGFIRSELNDDPAKLLGAKWWEKLLEIKTVFDKEKSDCKALMSKISWAGSTLQSVVDRFECEQCSSTLLVPTDSTAIPPDVELECRACGHKMAFTERAASLLDAVFWGDSFEAAKSGGDPPLYLCPGCGEETYLAEDDRCASCEYVREHKECLICHERLSPDEQEFEGLCSYHAHSLGRDD
jgi:hypothetical protein